jgi:hypothetical protein
MGDPTIATVVSCARLWIRIVAALVDAGHRRWTHKLYYSKLRSAVIITFHMKHFT